MQFQARPLPLLSGQPQQRSQRFLVLLKFIGKVRVQFMALRDKVNGLQPPGQEIHFHGPDVILYWEIIPADGRQEIANGQAEAFLVQRVYIVRPGRIIGKKFGVSPAQRQIDLQAVHLERIQGILTAAGGMALEVAYQAVYLGEQRFRLPQRTPGFPDMGQQVGYQRRRSRPVQADG